MDKEIYYIFSILSESSSELSTRDIAAEIFKKYKIRVSSKIVQNYLWSYFRNEIIFNSSEFTYSLKGEKLEAENVSINFVDSEARTMSMKVDGDKINLSYNRSVKLEDLLKALVLLNLNGYNNKYDLLKNLNRYIDNL
jgi:hypothetical protein